jgi:hypothetical protein
MHPEPLLNTQTHIADRPPLGFLLAWYGLALALLLLLPYVRFHVAFWHLSDDQRTPLFTLAAGFAVSAVLSLVIRPRGLTIRFFSLIAAILAVFGIVFLCFLIRGGDSSRQVMLLSLAIALVLIPLGLYLHLMRGVAIVARTVGCRRAGDEPDACLGGAGIETTQDGVIHYSDGLLQCACPRVSGLHTGAGGSRRRHHQDWRSISPGDGRW